MYQLVAEVLDHAPNTLTAAEVLILVAIGESTRARGEQREIPVEDLARRARLDRRGLRDAVTRLGKNGIKVRVAIGLDRNGRPLYAVPGKSPRWVLPAFPPPPGCTCQTCREGGAEAPPKGGDPAPPAGNEQVKKEETQLPLDEKGEPQLRQAEPELRQAEPQHRQPDATAPPSPYVAEPVISQRTPTVTYLLDHTDADDEEARLLMNTIRTRYQPRRGVAAYIRGMAVGDLAELLDELRAARRPPAADLPVKCDQCGPNRLIELPGGRIGRCPSCHPLTVVRSA
ncbi:hypothetical protein AB0A95_30970 [Micromonospora sp. NPDC049230]|uniref:hypothetical protein n=1 Tax=Micromonospora sp. NPDC049230 TaxID=3155502 RepID=UPI0033D3FE27